MQKYVLIISQYYYSHVMMICETGENFEQKARGLICELEKYKRKRKCDSDIHYGDFEQAEQLKNFRNREYSSKYGRLNVNDVSGDIYFILSDSVFVLTQEIINYSMEDAKNKEHITIKIFNKTNKHHFDPKVHSIIEKYFKAI